MKWILTSLRKKGERVTHTQKLIQAAIGVLPLIGVAFILSSHSGASPSAAELRFRDDCDPASFNAAIGPGTCVGNGGTVLDKFIQELQQDKIAGAWRISPDNIGLDAGQPTMLVSRGGELHTFTRVQKFGGGIVEFLNQLSGNNEVAPECQNLGNPAAATAGSTPLFPGAVIAGPTAASTALPVGTTHFQCCIHPWMRTTIQVNSQH